MLRPPAERSYAEAKQNTSQKPAIEQSSHERLYNSLSGPYNEGI